MLISNGFYLGRDGSGYYIWNESKVKYLKSKSLDNAIKEARDEIPGILKEQSNSI
ncbi:hypothetical protein [Elizabethkingia ursingii]|uniref:hypothetical protein n=1 Tax=Elizabethkingia ursingii TaxID=1756150 RepID=UPI002012A503|nr:hypothetical protein [Elizabethkingia ursingii]MCL1671749.1 hypothetical protein [Elizabethkingia ursingii]